MPCELIWLVGTGIIPNFPSKAFEWFFSHAYSAEHSWKSDWGCLLFFIWGSLSLPLSLLHSHSALRTLVLLLSLDNLFYFFFFFFKLRETAELYLASPCLHWSLETPWAISWENSRAHIVYLLSSRDYCPLLLDVWCLENYCFLYFVHIFGCLGGMINQIPGSLVWLGEEMCFSFLTGFY